MPMQLGRYLGGVLNYSEKFKKNDFHAIAPKASA